MFFIIRRMISWEENQLLFSICMRWVQFFLYKRIDKICHCELTSMSIAFTLSHMCHIKTYMYTGAHIDTYDWVQCTLYVYECYSLFFFCFCSNLQVPCTFDDNVEYKNENLTSVPFPSVVFGPWNIFLHKKHLLENNCFKFDAKSIPQYLFRFLNALNKSSHRKNHRFWWSEHGLNDFFHIKNL